MNGVAQGIIIIWFNCISLLFLNTVVVITVNALPT